jgi:hypothetical protein
MRNKIFGRVLVLHGMAHTLAGMRVLQLRAAEEPPRAPRRQRRPDSPRVAGDRVGRLGVRDPAHYLGTGRRSGWRVGCAEPNRVLVPESRGTFVLHPLDRSTPRLIVRTRGGQPDNLVSVLMAPVGFLFFEPAHFIMERKMLLEIRERAEQLTSA